MADNSKRSTVEEKLTTPRKSVVLSKKPAKPSPQQLLARPEIIPRLLKRKKITIADIPNPHWHSNACTACHKSQHRAGLKNLRQNPARVDKLCNTCHAPLSRHAFIHTSNIKVPKAMKRRMPRSFRSSLARGGNKMTCITCHDLPMTCKQKRRREKGLNPMFFRGGPYSSRTSLCYKCHNAKKYQRVNAHDQIDDKGRLRKAKCQICHTINQDMATANILDDVEFNIKEGLARLCWGCHPWKPHPGGSFAFFHGKGGMTDHLVKPPADMLERMRKMQEVNDLILPLEPGTGKVYCATCHNPHERGVIKVRRAARGADEKKRLRMQGICTNCHDK